ncbi:MAG: hypothetical protein ACQEVA_07690 [Myxococcota bacterium]
MMRRRPHSLTASLLALLASLLLYSACDLSASCTVIGCPQDQRCNEQTGECVVPVEFDCTLPENTCPDGQECDPASQQCRPIGERCSPEGCGPGQTCNTTTGICEAILNCDPEIDPCTSPAEVCDDVTNRCVPKPCSDDVECGRSHYCADTGECRDGCRPDRSNCPDGQFCRVSSGAEIGQCVEECVDDSDCQVGQRCESSGEGFACVIQRCEDDADCRDEAVCRGQFCVPPPCTTDDDCLEPEYCDVATGQCLGGDCEDDSNAPNHRLTEATTVETRTEVPAVLCPGRGDWYAYDLRSSDTFRVRMEHEPDADLDLYVYAEDRELIALNQATTQSSSITVVSWTTQTVYVEVRGHIEDSVNYSISFDQNPDVQCRDRDDRSDENDTREQATPLAATPGQLTKSLLTICGSDEDWFVLRDLDATYGLSIDQTGGEDHLRTELLGPDGAVIPIAEGETSEIESLRIRRLGVAGDYYIRIRSTQNRTVKDLNLDVEVTPRFECPDAQQHNTPEAAIQQEPGPLQSHSLCPLEAGWEVEWIELTPPQSTAFLYVQLSPSIGLPGLNVDLLRRTASDEIEPVRRAVLTAVPNGVIYELRVPAEPTDEYFLRLSADGEPGRIIDRVTYNLFYSFEPF